MLTKIFSLNHRHLTQNPIKLMNLYQHHRLRLQTSLSQTQILIKKFSTSTKNNAIPPVLWLVVKPFSKFVAIIAGRGFRSWWKTLRPHLTYTVMSRHLQRNKSRYFVITSGTAIGGTGFYVTHLQTAPITNRKRFILFHPSQIDDIELLAKDALNEEYGKLIVTQATPEVKRILRVLNRIVDANKDIEQVARTNWNLTVIDHDMVNAAAFPSGHIIVFTGLLDFVANDDELAAVLGHEISHAILQHTAENLSRSRLIDLFSILVIMVIWTVFPSDITAGLVHYFSSTFLQIGLELPFSRYLETEADEVGITLAAKACYDVRYFPLFWRRQSELVPEYVSTHPSNENRANEIERKLPEALKIRDQCQCYKLPDHLIIPKVNIKNVVFQEKKGGPI